MQFACNGLAAKELSGFVPHVGENISVTARWAKQTWSAHRPANLLHLSLRGHGRRFTQNTLEKQTNLEISPNFKSVRHSPPPVTVLVKSETEDTSPRTVMGQLKHKVANGPSTNVLSFDVCLLPGRLHVFQVTELKTASARTARYQATCALIVFLSKRICMDIVWIRAGNSTHHNTSKNKHGTKNRPIQKLLVKLTGIIQKSYRTTPPPLSYWAVVRPKVWITLSPAVEHKSCLTLGIWTENSTTTKL